jgi:hypothetical protein
MQFMPSYFKNNVSSELRIAAHKFHCMKQALFYNKIGGTKMDMLSVCNLCLHISKIMFRVRYIAAHKFHCMKQALFYNKIGETKVDMLSCMQFVTSVVQVCSMTFYVYYLLSFVRRWNTH